MGMFEDPLGKGNSKQLHQSAALVDFPMCACILENGAFDWRRGFLYCQV